MKYKYDIAISALWLCILAYVEMLKKQKQRISLFGGSGHYQYRFLLPSFKHFNVVPDNTVNTNNITTIITFLFCYVLYSMSKFKI